MKNRRIFIFSFIHFGDDSVQPNSGHSHLIFFPTSIAQDFSYTIRYNSQ